MLRHAFLSRHFRNMTGYFVAAAALTFILGMASAPSLLAGFFASVTIGVVGLSTGLAGTIALRGLFGLMQTGRVVQYLCFFLGTWLGVFLAGLLIPSLVVAHGWLLGLTVFAIAFGCATLTGEVPLKGRTWLPMKMPKR